jgi:energy-coupling factor transporter transmembrane protein EcfT
MAALGSVVAGWGNASLMMKLLARTMFGSLALAMFAYLVPPARWLRWLSRVPGLQAAADVALLALRILRELEQGYRTMDRAQRMRLGDLSWRGRWRSLTFAAAALLPLAEQRSRTLEQAMSLRGVGGEIRLLP